MRAPSHRTCLLVLSLGLLFPLLGRAETPAEVQQRLEQYRQLDAEAARKKAAQKAESERRREQNREWQEKRRREEYARRWRCYGDVEIDVLKWRQQKDGTWVTDFKELARSRNCSPTKGSLLPDLAGHRLWVKVRASISIEQLASALSQDESRLARLNDVDEDHQFQRGDWLVLPSQTSRTVKQLASVDTSELRRTPPLEALPEPQEAPVVRFGDSMVKIAQRYNLTISELLRLNPGLEAARLVVGTQIRLAQSSPGRSRMIVGLNPSASGGLSGTDSRQMEDSPPPRRFAQSLDELVRQGVFQTEERDRVLGGGVLDAFDTGAFGKACRSGALSSQECRSGLMIYRGRRAKSSSNPLPLPSSASLLGVNCTSLMINRKPAYASWGSWIRPEQGSADEQLVIDRCAAPTRMAQP